MSIKYPLAPSPIFWTIQGEGHLRGFQMAFLRLAGCSVGCKECDTDYRLDTRATADEIADRVDRITPSENRDRWCWITGGEPADYDLSALLKSLRSKRFSIAVATSGHKRLIPPVDWLSVSPHDPEKLVQTYGNEIKLIPGLNGLDPWEFVKVHPDSKIDFMYRYLQPLDDSKEGLDLCLKFLKEHPNWGLTRQDHKLWNLP